MEQEQDYENRINGIVEENNKQINSTKEQIEQFLDMIVQYEEEAAKEKGEVEQMREKIVELEIENDQLKNELGATTKRDGFSQGEQTEIMDKYALKIESLLEMIDCLQKENMDLNDFLKSCKCSRITSQKGSQSSIEKEVTVEEVVQAYERKLLNSEKEYIKEEMHLREAIRRKDECIDRLNLVIEEFRKMRYSSVDRMTADACLRQQ